MSRLLLTSDLHLGHKGILRFRPQFSSNEEHDETVFDNLASAVNKRDTLYLLGDIAFTKEWLLRVAAINCRHKLLICGNHDLERGIKMRDLVETYTDIKALYSKRNYWFSHCPIHPQELRNREGNIHGHLHDRLVKHKQHKDGRYYNVCVEHTNYKPVTFAEIQEKFNGS